MVVRRVLPLFLGASLLTGCASTPTDIDASASASHVEVVKQADGSYALLRDGEPYYVKGAGIGTGPGQGGSHLDVLAAAGGNSVRTWGIEQLDEAVDGKNLMDRAHAMGITVTAGFWVQHERHGFDYTNEERVKWQRERLRDAVSKHKDHPALLVWGLGNEMEAFETKAPDEVLWRELNYLAGIIKEMDPHHPVMTVISEVRPDKIAGILEHFPNLDILGVNSYGGAPTVGRRLVDAGWNGPYMLTEYGVNGPWEVSKTTWDAPIEADPSSKAAQTYTTYTLDRDDNAGRSLGSHVFFWGQKQEATATWFGMFLPTGEKLPSVDAMANAWSGEWPENRAPKLVSLDTPVGLKRVAPGVTSFAEADVVDREGDPLRYEWVIRAESTDRRVGGDAEAVPRSFPEAINQGQGTSRIEFTTPRRPGAYRVFVTAYDGQGGAAAHNVPFFVE